MKTTEHPLNTELEAMHPSLGSVPNVDHDSAIASFYSGKSIFITGATGFMGKVLVEKLLRSCSEVKSIYVLLRSKKGVEPKNRLNDLIGSRAFDRIRDENPAQLNKVIVIPGDITLPNMGISDEELKIVLSEVQIVFHSAATVKFDEPLKVSVDYNTKATRHIIELCRQMSKLQSFVHVSTCYSNCDRTEIAEEFYPPPAPPQKIIEMTDWMDEETLNSLTDNLLAKRPNTYTYTKALAEGILAEEGKGLPLAVVRPSIVTASWREPFPGWVDNINGPTGLVLASGKGLLRTMLYDPAACADLIPVDMVINLMISVAWHTATARPDKIRIYNCASGMSNGIRWADIEKFVFPLLFEFPSEEVFRYPGGTFKESRFHNHICKYYDHILPAYAFDTMAKILGKKPMMVRLYEKLHRAIRSLEWFTTHHWNFRTDNVIEMADELQGIDKKVFNFDVRNLDWSTYWQEYILGIRKFILKEDPKSLPKARTKLKRVYYTQKIISFLFLFGLWHLIMRTTTANTLMTNTIGSLTTLAGKYFTPMFGYTVTDYTTNNVMSNTIDSVSQPLVASSAAAASSSSSSPSLTMIGTNITDSIVTNVPSTLSAISSTILGALTAITGIPLTSNH